MGVEYQLVNQTKKEIISFSHLPVGKMRELSGNPVSAAMVTWYMLKNQGDMIQFVSDSNGEWPFSEGDPNDMFQYKDVTNSLIFELVSNGILRDNGKEWVDEDEPDTVYMRAIKNIWLDN